MIVQTSLIAVSGEVHDIRFQINYNIKDMREKLGAEPANQACVLTGNQTQDLLVYGMTPNQLNHMGQGPIPF